MKIINKILGWLIAFLVGVMVLGCCWQVITRFLLNNPSKYTEEFLRYALIWMTMLGAVSYTHLAYMASASADLIRIPSAMYWRISATISHADDAYGST